MTGPRSSTSQAVQVLIVDDHNVIRRAVAEFLEQESDFHVCGAVASGPEALEVMARTPVDVAVVDIHLGVGDGLKLTEQLRAADPGLIVLILSMEDDPVHRDRAARAGAAGFVPKQEASETLIPAVRRVLGGQTYYPATP
jgi:DNA-binding NarL/FixJ family response regulator